LARRESFDYYQAFKKQIACGTRLADILIEVIENFTTAEAVKEYLDRAHEIEHECDEITHDIYTAVAVDFITPIERDDILELAQALDDICDGIEAMILNFYMMDVHFMHHDIVDVARLLKKSCEALEEAISEFSNFKKSTSFKEALVRVNDYEQEADELHLEMMHKLFTVDKEEPVRVVVWSRLFVSVESCCDQCEHVADVMSTIVLKNS